MTRKIRLNAFNMNCVGHIHHGLWKHPRDNSVDYNKPQYWTDLAKLLERGLFDSVFLADIVGVYDVLGGGIDVTAREAVQLPVNDPLYVVPIMAQATEHLGFGVTCNLRHEHPYLFARRMATLDHLTSGPVLQGRRRLQPHRAVAAAHAGAVPGGASQRGNEFAAKHAECVFTGGPDRAALARIVANIRGLTVVRRMPFRSIALKRCSLPDLAVLPELQRLRG